MATQETPQRQAAPKQRTRFTAAVENAQKAFDRHDAVDEAAVRLSVDETQFDGERYTGEAPVYSVARLRAVADGDAHQERQQTLVAALEEFGFEVDTLGPASGADLSAPSFPVEVTGKRYLGGGSETPIGDALADAIVTNERDYGLTRGDIEVVSNVCVRVTLTGGTRHGSAVDRQGRIYYRAREHGFVVTDVDFDAKRVTLRRPMA